MAVAGMAAYSEISRAHETANEVRRINKQLKDAQQMAVTYNNRERLFGMPVTNVSVIIDFFQRRVFTTKVWYSFLIVNNSLSSQCSLCFK